MTDIRPDPLWPVPMEGTRSEVATVALYYRKAGDPHTVVVAHGLIVPSTDTLIIVVNGEKVYVSPEAARLGIIETVEPKVGGGR